MQTHPDEKNLSCQLLRKASLQSVSTALRAANSIKSGVAEDFPPYGQQQKYCIIPVLQGAFAGWFLQIACVVQNKCVRYTP